MTDDRTRHLELARRCASWASWTSGQWFCDGAVAIKTPYPFDEERRLDLDCGDDAPDHPYHLESTSLSCVFVDAWERDDYIVDRLRRLLSAAEQRPHLSAEPGRVIEPSPDPRTYRWVHIRGLGRIAVQAQFLDAATDVARVDGWRAVADAYRLAPADQRLRVPGVPLLVGLRDREIVALVMPAEMDDSLLPTGISEKATARV